MELLSDRIARHARERGRELALRDDGGDTSFAELWSVATRVASGLAARGVEPGDRVALALEPSAPYVALVLGLMLAGAVPAPMNTRLAEQEARAYLEPLAPVLLVTDAAHQSWSQALAPSLLVAAAPGPLEQRLRELVGDQPLAALQRDAPAIVFPTGGTTGLPKGAWYTHARLAAFCASVAVAQQRSSGDVEVYFSPFFHVSLCTGLLTSLHAGGAVHVLPRFDTAATLDAVRRGGSRLMGSPTMFVALRADEGFTATDRSGVRQVAFGATDATKPFVDALLTDYPQARLFYGYRATEFGPVTAMPHEVMLEGSRTGVGRALPGVDLRVVGTEGTALAPGEVGELAVSCPWQANGY
ncbi:MAG: class I adenylate-forming enzyme family protein, partial [Mycobacteriales bacterium]